MGLPEQQGQQPADDIPAGRQQQDAARRQQPLGVQVADVGGHLGGVGGNHKDQAELGIGRQPGGPGLLDPVAAELVEHHGQQGRQGDHEDQLLHHPGGVDGHLGAHQQPQRQGNEEGGQQGVQNDQRQGQRAVAPVDGHPHQPHHRRGHREFQHHARHHVGVVREEQPSQAAGRRGQHQVERHKAGQQGQGAAEHRGDIPEAGFQPADEGHEGEDQWHIGHPQSRHRGKQHPRRQTAGGDQKHPLFQKTVAALQHRTIPPTGDPPGQKQRLPNQKKQGN